MQSFQELLTSNTLTESRAIINNNIKTVMSCSSGTAFPTVDVQVGMLCLRTDTNILYELKSTGPDTWVAIADLTKTATNKEYVDAGLALKSDLTHNHDSRYYQQSQVDTLLSAKSATTHLHTGVYEPVISTKNSAFNKNFAGSGAATTVARSDHNHDAAYSAAGHNHDAAYLGITAKAADADLLDGRSSGAFVWGVTGGNVAGLSYSLAMSGQLATLVASNCNCNCNCNCGDF